MSNWASMRLKVNLKTKCFDEANKMLVPIKRFCTNHKIELKAVYLQGANILDVYIQVDGLTSKYCRGCMHEVRQMFRDIYRCRVETLVEAY